MTKATIYNNSLNGEIVGFRTEDHAGYSYAGNDIVCAAISVLVINTINSVEEFTDSDVEIIQDEENAIIELMVKSTRNHNELQVLLKALVLGLQSIAQDNSDYLSITFKEV